MLFLVCCGLLVASLFLQLAVEDQQLQMAEETRALVYRLHVITISIGGGGLILMLLYFGFFILP